MSRVKVISDGTWQNTSVLVDGERLTNVTSVSWDLDVKSGVATATIVRWRGSRSSWRATLMARGRLETYQCHPFPPCWSHDAIGDWHDLIQDADV